MKKKIAFIAQPEYFRFIYENDLDDIFEVREFSFNFNMSEGDFDELIEFNADYNIFFRGEFFPNTVLHKIRGIKVALSSEPFPRVINEKWEFTFDSISRYIVFRKIRNKLFDYVFHYDKTSMPLFEKDGLFLSGEFIFPVARKTYSPMNNICEKKWDIFFIGRSTVHREKFFGPLKHHFNFLHVAHGIHGVDLSEYLNKSVICINAHAENEISWEPRMQMMLSSGAFVLSEKITPNDYLKPGIDFVEYSTPRDLYEKVSFYLRNKKYRDEIVNNAQKTMERHFDSQVVFKEFFEKIENGEFKKFNSKKGKKILNLLQQAIDVKKFFANAIRKFNIKRIKSLLKNILKEFKRNGFTGVFRRVLNAFGIDDFTVDFISFLFNIKRSLLPRRSVYGKSAKISYVVPGVKISGGVAVVLNHVNYLKKRGYNVSILTLSEETNIDWFPNAVPVISVINDKKKIIKEIDTLIATHWSTAFWVNASAASRRMYFVQSDERRFNPENNSEIKSITDTYKMDLEFLTEAKWIQRWLKDEFNKDAYYVPNGLDVETFFKENTSLVKSNIGRRPRILIEGPIDFWFKGMNHAYNAIKNLDCDVWIISSHGKPKNEWRYERFFENVPMHKMRDIYSECDIFLKMSYMEGFFGPPMEAMACGCAVVVGKVTGYDEYIIDNYNALVVEQGNVIEARKAVQKLIENLDLRNKLISNGYSTVKNWSWNHSIDLLEEVVAGSEPVKYYLEDTPGYKYIEEIERLKNAKEAMSKN